MGDVNLPKDPIIPGGVSVTNIVWNKVAEGFFRDQARPLVEGVDYIPTPLSQWNKQCRDDGGGLGLARGWNIVIGGATGQGKSLAALNLAACACDHGANVGIISLEMSITQIKTRFYSILTGEPVRGLERGPDFDPAAGARVVHSLGKLREDGCGKLTVNIDPMWDLQEVLKLMTHYVKELGCTLVIVDYLQLIGAGDEREMTRAMTKVSHHMSAFAKRHKVVMLGLSQFNRQTTNNRFDSPTAQGLISSSSIENDSDQVFLLDHSRFERGKKESEYKDYRHLVRTYGIVAKNRHGPQGDIPILWDHRTLTVTEGLESDIESWPKRRMVEHR